MSDAAFIAGTMALIAALQGVAVLTLSRLSRRKGERVPRLIRALWTLWRIRLARWKLQALMAMWRLRTRLAHRIYLAADRLALRVAPWLASIPASQYRHAPRASRSSGSPHPSRL